MINIITNAELDVVEKQKALIAEALGPDSAYIYHTTTIIWISVNFKTTLTWMAWYAFVFTATI